MILCPGARRLSRVRCLVLKLKVRRIAELETKRCPTAATFFYKHGAVRDSEQVARDCQLNNVPTSERRRLLSPRRPPGLFCSAEGSSIEKGNDNAQMSSISPDSKPPMGGPCREAMRRNRRDTDVGTGCFECERTDALPQSWSHQSQEPVRRSTRQA